MLRRILVITKNKDHIITNLDTDEQFSIAANYGLKLVNPFNGLPLEVFYCGYRKNAYIFKE